MFAFDHTALPQLTTRKALIGVDFQHDFIAQDGALPVLEPQGFVERTISLANAFRETGDVVWVQSRFEIPRPAQADQIIATDDGPIVRTSSLSLPRGRRPSIPPIEVLEAAASESDSEAFLSHDEAVCVKADSLGIELASAIQETSYKTDMKLTKTQYSAFQAPQLLRVLRAKMVMELYICGSLTNIGVYATALDAAGHGMAITIVDDCCGFRSEKRKSLAIESLIELTGCEIASYDEVMETLQPKSKPKPKTKQKPKTVVKTVVEAIADTSPSVSSDKAPSSPKKPLEPSRNIQQEPQPDVPRKSQTPDFVKDMTGLRLASDPPNPAATIAPGQHQPQPHTKASLTCAAEHNDSELESQLKTTEIDGADAPATDTKVDVRHRDHVVEQDGTKVGLSGHQENNNDVQSGLDSITTVHKPYTAPLIEEPSTKAGGIMDKTESKVELHDDNLQQKSLCEGDTDIIENVLSESLAETAFDKLRDEVQWQRMSHQGGQVPRLVAVQGEVAEDGSTPVYRHPSDESPPLLPFSPTVQAIKAETEKHLGHTLNHVLIQFYRDGNDYISEHSDKTLDIAQNSYIANVSLGAERTMIFRTKRRDRDPSHDKSSSTDTKRKIQRAKLPHNSLCRLGLKSNMKWLHAIRQDKRPDGQKSSTELAFKGGRISLTFRKIGTFLDHEGTLIWGQGAKAKTREEAHAVVNGQTSEAIEMLKAFGTENHATDFDWDAHYGKGHDVLHMSNSPRFFASTDPIVNARIALMLTECGVSYAKGSITVAGSQKDANLTPLPNQHLENIAVKFIDKDKSVVQGDLAIMLYLDSRYGLGKPGSTPRHPSDLANQFTRFQQGMSLYDKWRTLPKDKDEEKRNFTSLKNELKTWDDYVATTEGQFLAGPVLTLPDFAVWPVLGAMVDEAGAECLDGLKNLKVYYNTMSERPSVKRVTGKAATSSNTRDA